MRDPYIFTKYCISTLHKCWWAERSLEQRFVKTQVARPPPWVSASAGLGSGLRTHAVNQGPGVAAAAAPRSWLGVALLYIRLPWRERCQGDLQGYPRRTKTRTVFKCDAWGPSVMGKTYSFCSMVLNDLLRTCAATPWAEALLCVAQRHYIKGRCRLSMLGALLCISTALLLPILKVGSCFTAVC